jgi:hypothetical protein
MSVLSATQQPHLTTIPGSGKEIQISRSKYLTRHRSIDPAAQLPQLNVTSRRWPSSWLTRADPPLSQVRFGVSPM